MILPIIAYGAAILRQPCQEITAATAGINELIKSMWHTLEHAKGAGLAAPQVNKPYRIFLISMETFKGTFINPRIVSYSNETMLDTEGCLSIPGIWEEVARAADITLEYQDEHFISHTHAFSGNIARAIQHEYDHLNGKLYLDYLSPLRKTLLKHKLKAIAKGKTKAPYPLRVL
ncbi:peptide deformylase [Chitinophaga sp. RAB17]|uniref:peptide deformylase n=1 Tax=Chitinophaga sp. RAB17 TaxID=3233049 RepID=UPI003F92EF56